MSVKNLGYFLAVAGAATFAARDVISRHVLTGISPPLVAAGFALLIGGAMLLVIIHRQVLNSIRDLPPKYIAICCVAGIFKGIAIGSLFLALSRAPVTVVSPINASSPLITLALAHIFLRRLESLNWTLVLGTVISVGGVVLGAEGGGNCPAAAGALGLEWLDPAYQATLYDGPTLSTQLQGRSLPRQAPCDVLAPIVYSAIFTVGGLTDV